MNYYTVRSANGRFLSGLSPSTGVRNALADTEKFSLGYCRDGHFGPYVRRGGGEEERDEKGEERDAERGKGESREMPHFFLISPAIVHRIPC